MKTVRAGIFLALAVSAAAAQQQPQTASSEALQRTQRVAARDAAWNESESLYDAGKLKAALEKSRFVTAETVKLFESANQQLVDALMWQGRIELELEDFDASLLTQGRLLDAMESIYGAKSPEATDQRTYIHSLRQLASFTPEQRRQLIVADDLEDQARNAYNNYNYKFATALSKRALELRAQIRGKESAEYAASLRNAAMVRAEAGDYTGALPDLIEAANLRQKILGKDHPLYLRDISYVMDLLTGDAASDFIRRGELAKAREAMSQAYNFGRAALGDEDWRTRSALARVQELDTVLAGKIEQQDKFIEFARALEQSRFAFSAGDYNVALMFDRSAMRNSAAACGQVSLGYAIAMARAARSFLALNDPTSAEPLIRGAIAVYIRRVGRDAPAYRVYRSDLIDTLRRLAVTAVELDDLVSAKSRMLEVLALEKEADPRGSFYIEDTQREVDHVARLAALKPEQRKSLREATQANKKAGRQYQLGNFTAALALIKPCVTARDSLLLETDPDRLEAAENHALCLDATYDSAAAVAAFRKLLESCEANLGKDHPRTARVANHLSNALQNRGHELVRSARPDHKAAREAFLESAKLKLQIFGPYHAQTFDAQWEVADLDKRRDLPESAKSKIIEARKLARQAREPAAPVAKSIELYRKALALDEESLGATDAQVASDLMELAVTLRRAGEFNEAETCYLRALRIRYTLWGPDHPLHADALNGLGRLYTEIANRPRARQMLEQALATRRRLARDLPFNAGEHNLDQITLGEALNNLAGALKEQGFSADARPLFEEATAIARIYYGEDSPTYAGHLTNLAGALPPSDNDIAKRHYENALAILDKKTPDSRQCGNTHGAMARLLEENRDFAGALTHLKKARDIFSRISGGNDILSVHKGIARMELLLGDPVTAAGNIEKALAGEQQILRNVMNFSSEAAVSGIINHSMWSLDVVCSIALAANQKPTTEQAFTWVLRRKGIILDTRCQMREALRRQQSDPAVRELAAKLDSMRQELDSLRLNPPAGRDPAALAAQRSALANEIDIREGELARKLSTGGTLLPTENVDLARVRKNLPAGSAMVEFIRLNITGEIRGEGGKPLPGYREKYLAFVIPADPKADAKLIDLGDAREIENLIQDFRAATDVFKGETLVRIARIEAARQREFDAVSRALYEKVFAPLEATLGATKRIYLAPDGDLSILPFDSLWDGKKYLVESRELAYLSTGRDLIETQASQPGKGTAVLAAVDFSATAEARKSALGVVEKEIAAKPATRPAIAGDRAAPAETIRDFTLAPLPGTQEELVQIRRMLDGDKSFGPVAAYAQAAASEDVLKRIAPPPRILHLATHGYFLPNTGIKIEEVGAEGAGGAARGITRIKGISDPLLRSGIVLAGADRVSENAAGLEDGWVSAAEIASLDLRGTELVVLSACSTGMGDIRDGEGVYGLRRAFKYAGAKSLLVSLFDVPDSATRELMVLFYANLKAGQDKISALHNAQLQVLKSRRSRPGLEGVAHPYFWANFIISGK
jgi:CHAT domain-containing protein